MSDKDYMAEFRVSIEAIVSLDSPAQLHAWIEGPLNRICKPVTVNLAEPMPRRYTPDPNMAGGMLDGICLYCSEPENRHRFSTKECLQ